MLTSDPIAAPSSLPISASASIARDVAGARPLDEDRRVRARPVELGGGPIGRKT